MATAGYTTIGSQTLSLFSSSASNPVGLLITMPVAGSITTITARVSNNNSSTSQTCSIYLGSAGSRGALQASTTASTVTTTPSWVDFTFASPFSASATTYWIQFNPDGGNGPGGNGSSIKYDTGGPANSAYLLNDSGTPQYDTTQYSLYATYSNLNEWYIALK